MPRRSPVPPPADWVPPAVSYAICTTPRSGSTYLGRLLRGACLGRPDEHAREQRHPEAQGRGAAAWMQAILHGGLLQNSPPHGAAAHGGVFGIKLFPPHHVALQQAGIALPQWLPGLKYLHLRRGDLVAQAVSFAIAAQDGVWEVGLRAPRTEPQYDAALIARLLDRLVEWESYWRRYFALSGVQPLELVYEEVASAPAETLATVRGLLGLPAATEQAARLSQVQRTERNGEWRQRFLADLASRRYRLLDRPQRARPSLASLRAWLAGELTRPAFRVD